MSVRRPEISSPSGSTSYVFMQAVRVGLRNPLLALDRREVAELLHAAGRLQVVEDRLVAGEALEAHHLFGEQGPVLPEDDVPLAGNVAATLVERHGRPFGVVWSG